MNSDRRVNALAEVKTLLTFNHRVLSTTSTKVPSNFIRLAKAITYSLRRAGLTSDIEVEVRWPNARSSGAEKQGYMIRFSGGTVIHTGTKSASSSLSRTWEPKIVQFAKWYKQQALCRIPVAERCKWETRWNVYEKFTIACRAFHFLKITRSCHVDSSIHPLSEDVDARSRALDREDLGRIHLLQNRARHAFCNQDDETLLHLLAAMQAIWSATNDHLEQQPYKSLASIFSSTPHSPAQRDDIKCLAVLHSLPRPTWPAVPPTIRIPIGAVGTKVDELYESFEVGGKEVRRLIR